MKLNRKSMTLALFFLLGVIAFPAQASTILLAGDSNIFTTGEDNEVFFQNVFNGQTVANYSSNSLSSVGVSATETNHGASATITSAGLAGSDFMLFGYNRTSVSAAELTAITNFYLGGGSLFLYGEGNTGFTNVNNAINAVLAAVGSSMSLSTTDNFDESGYTTLTSFSASGPYTTGVNSWKTGYTAKINLGSGSALISGVADAGFYGAAIAMEAQLPEPGTMVLLGLGLAGLGWQRRRRS
jgi:hypothetical protein